MLFAGIFGSIVFVGLISCEAVRVFSEAKAKRIEDEEYVKRLSEIDHDWYFGKGHEGEI